MSPMVHVVMLTDTAGGREEAQDLCGIPCTPKAGHRFLMCSEDRSQENTGSLRDHSNSNDFLNSSHILNSKEVVIHTKKGSWSTIRLPECTSSEWCGRKRGRRNSKWPVKDIVEICTRCSIRTLTCQDKMIGCGRFTSCLHVFTFLMHTRFLILSENSSGRILTTCR